MSLRRELEQHRHSLAEIRDIMNSMKTLAYMETRKLAQCIDAQRAVVESIESAAADLLAYHPLLLPDTAVLTSVYLLIGSERGFCGDFNHVLLQTLEQTLRERGEQQPLLIVTGRKLYSMLEGDKRLAIALDGASVAEEISEVLGHLVMELTGLEEQHPGLAVYCLFHRGGNEVAVKSLLPPFPQALDVQQSLRYPPVLNLPPQTLFTELSEHYLFAVLHQMLYTSLHAENHNRVTHMESAVNHLDEEAEHLRQRFNSLRQEEITEEIEVILLNAANLEGCCPETQRLRRRK